MDKNRSGLSRTILLDNSRSAVGGEILYPSSCIFLKIA